MQGVGIVARWSLLLALAFAAFGVGASLFEHLVIDPVWPRNLRVIQPQYGGVNRATFWIVLHTCITLPLLVATIACWRAPELRRWVLAALLLYVVMRMWSFAYFIPEALSYERMEKLPPAEYERARTWVRLSVVRSLLLLGSALALARAAMELPRRGGSGPDSRAPRPRPPRAG